ncbi:MAG: hypothetical protein PHS92_05010 [Candidatus Gracilibacteria bacterium]|nr:hypothetical protein [Candidatus Gracilibacteria bacterium]
MFEILDGKGKSLDDIKTHQLNGGSVLRSAHVGNFNMPTIFLAQEGFPIILHEFLKGTANIYEPAFLKVGNAKVAISENPDSPLTHDTSLIRNQVMEVLGYDPGEKSSRPAQIHFDSLKKLPSSNITLSSEFLLGFPKLHDFLLVLAKTHPRQFGNYILENGTILNSEPSDTESQRFFNEDIEMFLTPEQMADMAFENLKGTTETFNGGSEKNSEGIIFRSNIYILLSTLVDFYRLNGDPRKSWDAIHFSGTQMMNYLIRNKALATENQKELCEMFNILKKEFPDDLPEKISFHLVSTEGIGNIVTTDSEKKKLQEAILESYMELQGNFRLKGDIQKEISDLMQEKVAIMSSEDLKSEIESIFNNLSSIPAGSRKMADQTFKMLGDPEKEPIIRKNLISLLLVKENPIELDGRVIAIKDTIQRIKTDIANLQFGISAMSDELPVTQYDILHNGKTIGIPEQVRSLSMHELGEHIKYTNNLNKNN